jgi:hypothetical protein
MAKQVKGVLILAVILAACLSGVAAAIISGSAAATGSVKLTPVTVELTNTDALPSLAEVEGLAVWNLFDRNTDTPYIPSGQSTVTISFVAPEKITRLHLFGTTPRQLNVYYREGDTWVPVAALSYLDLATLTPAWNILAAAEPFTTECKQGGTLLNN